MKREHEINDKLPDGYSELEYIESTGTQYIRTGLVPDYTLEWFDDFQLTGTGTYSTGITLYDTYSLRMLKERYGNNGFISQYGGADKKTQFTNCQIDANRHTWLVKNGQQVFDDVMYGTDECEAAPNSLEMVLFCRNDGRFQYMPKMRLYLDYEKVNGSYARYFVPALRLSDNKPGLYDLCGSICPLTGTPFYINAGTGEFLYK